ncbi:MAG TPA: phosphatase PAP2 family protein [Gemmatimonadales bacterium]|nr:phosphatase PAP2 family protein [Gemmatimonadales bacterium]
MLLLLVALGITAQSDSLRPRSVYRLSLAADAPVTLISTLGIVVPYALAGRLITPRCPCNPQEVNGFDRGAIGNENPGARRLSDATAGAVMVLPLVLDAVDIGVNDVWAADAEVFTETLVVNGALVTAAKYIVQRPLPRTYAGDPNLINQPGGYRSFYSGHTSLVFAGLVATAMTMRLRYGEKVWPWVVTSVVGTSVAIERVADGRHFPSDVIVGALMGSATGIAVPWLHARAQSRHQRLRFAFARPGGIGLIYAL